jgi:MFS transporter, putative metabolite:H+ symporter
MPAPGAAANRATHLAVLVAALGYFVDIYDLILFSVIRIKSLGELGLSGEALTTQGLHLLDMQMYGMLLGGILWGVLGDRRGRLSVLFGSILLYSVANILNGMVSDVETYAWLRLIAGVGLAGELGAGITLVAELMTIQGRGYGTMVVAGVGLMGGIVAGVLGDILPWRTAYYVGGGMGMLLLALRLGVRESGMFAGLQQHADVRRGDFFALFTNLRRLRRYLAVIVSGLPIWFVFAILVSLAPEMGAHLGLDPAPTAARAVLWAYVGIAVGDLASGTLSQWLRSRRKVMALFIALIGVTLALYLSLGGRSLATFYALCVGVGFASGYWAVFVTTASEQFGTNLRATVTTTAPNFVRGAVPLLTAGFTALKPGFGVSGAALGVGVVCVSLALLSVWRLEETFGRDLDYIEQP